MQLKLETFGQACEDAVCIPVVDYACYPAVH